MPFGFVSCGFYGDTASYYHSWVCKYLHLLGSEWDAVVSRFGETIPDALFFISGTTEWQPMSYAQALSAFRGVLVLAGMSPRRGFLLYFALVEDLAFSRLWRSFRYPFAKGGCRAIIVPRLATVAFCYTAEMMSMGHSPCNTCSGKRSGVAGFLCARKLGAASCRQNNSRLIRGW